MSAVVERPVRRVVLKTERKAEAGSKVRGKGERWLRQLVRAWLSGWLAFAGAAGGRAEDLVGGNPWARGKGLNDAKE